LLSLVPEDQQCAVTDQRYRERCRMALQEIFNCALRESLEADVLSLQACDCHFALLELLDFCLWVGI